MALIPALGERQVDGYLSLWTACSTKIFPGDYTQKHCLEKNVKTYHGMSIQLM